MYSRSIPDGAGSTVKTTPAGSCEPCQLAGEELQPDVAGAQFLRERGEVDAAAESLVLVDDDGHGGVGGPGLAGEGDGFLQLWPLGGAGRRSG
ncbi:hypothetical protein [Streptomyces anulatus]|uniref:hypothetical protein n=1 Tax=Streptomyces anulatus TaxID=1892 RepID=UPI001C2682E7|nr:hypothetical protein [Streptomyces anulatus]